MTRSHRIPLLLGLVALLGVVLGLGVASAASLPPIASAKLWGGSQTLTKTTCNLGASAADDTWINEASPNQKNGGSSTISISNASGSLRYGLITFDLSSCALPTTGGADAATLTLYVTNASRTGHTISLYPIYSSWSGSTMTWNMVGGLSIGTPVASFSNSTGSKTITVTADVDAAIKAGVLWGWGLVDTAGSGTATTTIASSSNSNASRRPSLVVNGEQ